MAEVAYQFKDVVKYMSISPNTEGGYGWDYELMMKWMTVGITPLEVTNNIVKAYHDSTLTQTSETQTAVDLAYADSLKTAIDALAAAMYNENNKSALETTILSSIDFSQGDYTNYPFFEVGKFCASITASTTYSANLKTAAQNVINALSNIVTYAYANSAMGNYYGTGATVKKGLAIVFPVNKSTKASTYSSVGKWYTSRNMSATSTPYGNLIFCSFDNDGVVETWKELLEAWYDGGNTLTGDTY
jgi:clostripain